MSTGKFGGQISPDGTTVDMTIEADGVTLPVSLNAEQVEKWIYALGDIRMQMLPTFPMDVLKPTRMSITVGFAWRAGDQRLQGGRPLYLRHPGWGWTTWIFSDADAASAAKHLTAPIKDDPFDGPVGRA